MSEVKSMENSNRELHIQVERHLQKEGNSSFKLLDHAYE